MEKGVKFLGCTLGVLLVLIGCSTPEPKTEAAEKREVNSLEVNKANQTSLIVLGTIQDAGSPQVGCTKSCCKALQNHPDETRKVVSLGVYDAQTQKTYLFEATPDFTSQTALLRQFANSTQPLPNGIFLTHAHIGHYTGLMYLGKEAINATKTPVYAMPRMQNFLRNNGPWSQLVKNENIELNPLQANDTVVLSDNLKVIPMRVPHRDEFSETVGYKIIGPSKTVLFIPDIDKWEKWETPISKQVASVDYAFIDATFYSGKELGNRDMSQIPHPSIEESMEWFEGLTSKNKAHVQFIHFNHTNPVLDTTSEAYRLVNERGYNIARFGQVFKL